MTHFNLNHLRADAECYAPGHHRDDHAIIIDFIIEALIGSDYYAVMIRNPHTTIRFDFRGSHQVLNMTAYKWAGFEDII
jgi:hypothetical protein